MLMFHVHVLCSLLVLCTCVQKTKFAIKEKLSLDSAQHLGLTQHRRPGAHTRPSDSLVLKVLTGPGRCGLRVTVRVPLSASRSGLHMGSQLHSTKGSHGRSAIETAGAV